MEKTTQIRSLIRSIAGTDRPSFDFRLMEVVGVEGDLCRAKIGDFEIPDIRLSAIADGSANGLLVVPAVGSIILVADISCGNLRELCAVGYSEVASVRFHQGKTTLTANAETVTAEVGASKLRIEDGQITLDDGANHGLVKVEDLITKINAVERSINELKTLFSRWKPVPQDGGAALQETAASWAGSPLKITQQADIENPKITH